MPRKLLLQPFEISESETWAWKTDVLKTVSNEEQRIMLRDYPNESLQVVMRFGADGQTVFANETVNLLNGQDALIRTLHDLIIAKDEITIPIWHQLDAIDTANSTLVTASQLDFQLAASSGAHTPFYTAAGEQLLVQAGGVWHLAMCISWSAVTRSGTLAFNIAPGLPVGSMQSVVPLREGLIDEQSTEELERAAQAGKVSFTVQLSRLSTGTRTLNSQGYNLNTNSYLGLPVVDSRNRSDSTPIAIRQGTQTIDTATNFPFYVTRWQQAQFELSYTDTFPRYQSNRYAGWKAFLAAARGMQGLFWLPTRHDDFEIVATVGTNGCTLRGRQYFDLWTDTQLKALCLDTGLESVRVIQVVDVDLNANGDTECLFQTSTSLVNPIKQVSIALCCRLKADEVQFTHSGRYSSISFSVCSVPVTWTPQSYGAPLLDVYPDDTGAELSERLPTATIGATILQWWAGDNLDNTLNGSNEITAADIVPASTGSPSNGPIQTVLVNGRRAPKTDTSGILSSDVAANYAFLTANTGTAQISVTFRVDTPVFGSDAFQQRIFYTASSTTSANGIIIALDQLGRLTILVRSNNLNAWTYTRSTAFTAGQVHTLQFFRLSGSAYTAVLNGATLILAAVTNPLTGGTPDNAPAWGARSTREFLGTICEGIVRNAALSTSAGGTGELERNYLDRWKTALNPTNLIAFRGLPNRGTAAGNFRARLHMRPMVGVWQSRRAVFYDNTTTSSPWRALISDNPASFNALRSTGSSYLLSIRFEAGPVNSSRLLISTATGTGFRIYHDNSAAIVLQIGRTTSTTTAGGLIVAGKRYTLQVYRTPALDTYYLDGVSIGTNSTALVSSAVLTSFELGSSNLSNGHRAGRYHALLGTVSATKRAQIRAQLVADWPDENPILFSVDGSSAGAVLVPGQQAYSSIPITGEFSGTMLADGQLQPTISPSNGLPGPHFNSENFNPLALISSPGAVPFLWAEPDQGGTTTGFGESSGTALITVVGTFSVQYQACWVQIVLSGTVGFSQYQISYDNGANWSPSRYTAPTVTEGPFTITFGPGLYGVTDYRKIYVRGIPDMSGQGNDLLADGTGGLPIEPYSLNGRAAWLATTPAALTRFFSRATLTAARSITGRMTVIVVGNSGPTPADSVLFGGTLSARVVYIQPSGIPSIASTAHGALAGAVTANKPFVYVARFNGTSSQIIYRQQGLADMIATVDPGDPAAVPLTSAAWGGITGFGSYLCEGMKFYSVFAVDEQAGALSDADVDYLLQGFSQRYGIENSSAGDAMHAQMSAGPAALSFMHQNVRNWALAVAVRFDPTFSDSLIVFELLNAAGTAGFRLRFNAPSALLFCDFVGPSGTTSQSLSLGYLYTDFAQLRVVLELRFTSGAGAAIEVFADGVSKGTLSFAAHTFSTLLQDKLPTFGKGRGFALFEMLIRNDFASQAEYLRDKWFPALWADLLTNTSGDLLTNTDGDLLVDG